MIVSTCYEKKVLFLCDKNNTWSFKYLEKFIEELKLLS